MKKILIAIIVILVAGIGIWYVTSMDKNNNDSSGPVAVVNGDEISRAEFEEAENQFAAQQGTSTDSLDKETREQIKTNIIDSLISQKLLNQAVESSEIVIESEQIDAQMEIFRSQFENDEMFQEALRTQSLTEESLRSKVTIELTTEAYFNEKLNLSSVTVSEDEINTAYEEISATQEVPALEEVREEVRQFVLGQKKRELIFAHIAELRSAADIEILI
ncbi:MAG: hypothetical protein COX06_02785 [Candidatus Zambryskibacteria bacterium CG22_combo_CG10-13_8_21_14_all_42_17]|uniref:Peptidylprolyl isomerase n=1 Tax=Candidatus Zambryskibacteria bacterium CG22_combo_CG10-13_8_21_14_all_42_17 TaxID=1975118 RepID=A0A2H0BD00_9BACT|nr:MAG: hypothetical protein COX06_02785 [Candidatus Zambryskibacteria bacterium CG22_combo_CG10-13_8_21_14_all_42_17]